MNTLHSNRRNRLFSCKSILLGAAAAAAALLNISAERPCLAANIVLSSGNSSVTIDPTSTAGVEDWTINGQNQLNQEWFWFHTAGDTGQSSLNSLGTPAITPLTSSMTELTYGPSTSLQVTVIYSVTGGQSTSSTADLTDTIEIDNHSSKSLTLDFFQYANFNLGDSVTGQSLSISGSATTTVIGNGFQAQTVVSPDPTDFEADISPTLLDKISSATQTATLSNSANAGPGDTEWGYEWALTIPMCGSAVITGDSVISAKPAPVLPEPVSGAASMLGLGGMLMTRPRRRDEVPDNRTVQVTEA